MTLGMNGCSSWGDCLYITAALNVIPGSTIQLHKGHQEEWVSKAFDGLANVEFVDSPLERIYVKNKDKTHSSQRVLNELKIDHLTNCIPKVIVTEKEESWAKDFLEKYLNPIVIINDNSGGWDATNYRAHYVRPSIELMQDICYHLTKKGYTPLQFGHSEDSKFTPLDGAIQLRGLTLRENQACFKIIKKYIGGDTGQYHSMLSVGGQSICLHPDESKAYGYEFWDMFYLPELWKDEKIRVKYVNFNTCEYLEEFLEFKW